MKLDKKMKYEFCGEVYEQGSRDWYSGDRSWEPSEFQFFADHGHVKDAREPLVFEGEIFIDNDGDFCGLVALMRRDDTKGKTFKVTWTEVV